jgi:hypothetical protein
VRGGTQVSSTQQCNTPTQLLLCMARVALCSIIHAQQYLHVSIKQRPC